MDNATRKDLLYKARAAGYPGSILDVFANYDQGRDLIAEFQQQQQMQQAQQMSDAAAQQSGMQQPQQQMQQPQQPQIPVVPSSPTPAPKFTPPQPPQPIGVQSQQTQMGLVSGQTGPNQGRAIFKTGGVKTDPPSYTLPTLEIKATRNAPIPKMLEPGFKEELAYQEAKNKLMLRQQLEGAQARFMGGENFLDAFKDHNLAGQAFQTMLERYPDDKRLTSKETTRGAAAGNFLLQQAFEHYTGKKFNIPKQIQRTWDIANAPNEFKDFQDAERKAQNKYANYTEELQDKVDTYEKAHGTYQPGLFERMRKTHFKFATGGFSEGPGCPDGYFKDKDGNCVPLVPSSNFRGKEYYTNEEDGKEIDPYIFKKSEGCFNYDCGEAGYREYPRYLVENIQNYGNILSRGADNFDYKNSSSASRSDEEILNEHLDFTDPKSKSVPHPDAPGANMRVTTETAKERAERAKKVNVADLREKDKQRDQTYFATAMGNFAKFNKWGEQKPLTFAELNDLTGGYTHEYLFNSDASKENKEAVAAAIEPKSYQDYVSNALAFNPKEVNIKKNVYDEEGKPRVFGENVTADFKKIKTYKEKKLGGAKCYTCVGRKRRV